MYLKHENILPVLLYNIQAALNLTVYMYGREKDQSRISSHFRGCNISSFMVIFCLLFFRLKISYVPVINFPGEELNKL